MANEAEYPTGEEAGRIVELAQAAIETRDPWQLAAGLLPALAAVTYSPVVLLYVAGGQAGSPGLFHYGLSGAGGHTFLTRRRRP